MRSNDGPLGVMTAAAIAAVLFAAVLGGPALAAKGGNGNGNGHGHGNGSGAALASTVTFVVSPDPVPAWGYVYTVVATGFTPGNAVNFVQDGVATYARADENGSASTVYTSWEPRSHTVFAKEWINGSYEVVGSVTFEVVEQ